MSRCNHTFLLCAPLIPGRHCTHCLSPPRSTDEEVHRCNSCGAVIHQHCFNAFIQSTSEDRLQTAEGTPTTLSSTLATTSQAAAAQGGKLWTSFQEFMWQQQLALTSAPTTSENGNKTVSSSWPFASFFNGREMPKVSHIHRMMPTVFYYPTRCTLCVSSSQSPPSSSTWTPEMSGEAKSTSPATALMGFGTHGYCCVTCSLTIHRECFRAMDPSTYEEVPIQEETEEKEETDTSTEVQMNLDLNNNLNEKDDFVCSDFSVDNSTDGISAAVRFIGRYIFNTHDPNTIHLLGHFNALLQRFSSRHPSIGVKSLNPYNIAAIRARHKELYKLCCDALNDADFIVHEGPDGPTMAFLRDAMRCASAAYGNAYKSGLLSSVVGGVMGRTVHRDVFFCDDAVNDRAVTDLMGLPSTALAASRWSIHALEPSYALLLDHSARRIVFTFRGTLSDGDVLSDVCAYGDPFAGGHAHQGAAKIVSFMFEYRASQLTPAAMTRLTAETSPTNATIRLRHLARPDVGVDTLCTLVQQHPNYDVLVTGHSLGGGVALLFGVRAIRENLLGSDATSRLRVVAFAPMPVLTMPAAGSFKKQLWSIVSGVDAVCRLQLNALDRLAAEIASGGSPGGSANHVTDLTEEMHHPGRVFLLTTPWETATNRMVEVPRGNFLMHHVFISSNLVSQHFVDNYTAALREVHLRE